MMLKGTKPRLLPVNQYCISSRPLEVETRLLAIIKLLEKDINFKTCHSCSVVFTITPFLQNAGLTANSLHADGEASLSCEQ